MLKNLVSIIIFSTWTTAAFASDNGISKSASGLTEFRFTQKATGEQNLSLASKKGTYRSEIDEVTTNLRFTSLPSMLGEPGSYGTIRGESYLRASDLQKVSGGCNYGGCDPDVFERNLAPRISNIEPFLSGNLDFLKVTFSDHDGSRQQTFQVPLCGWQAKGSLFAEKTSAEVFERIKDTSKLKSSVSLSYPLQQNDELLAHFVPLPAENFQQVGRTLRAVLVKREDYLNFYEFIVQSYGVEVVETVINLRSVPEVRRKSSLIAILPSEISLSDIQVGTAYDLDPFGTSKVVQGRIFIKVKYKNENYLLTEFRETADVQGRKYDFNLANVRYSTILVSSRDKETGQKASSNDLNNILQHQCFLQAFVRP